VNSGRPMVFFFFYVTHQLTALFVVLYSNIFNELSQVFNFHFGVNLRRQFSTQLQMSANPIKVRPTTSLLARSDCVLYFLAII
jgi:hypothetical protein